MSKTISSSAFEEAYKSLNTAQKQAVDTIDGPVMVIAGPGTGKTQILTLRIANILLQTDMTPDSILALTFTESGAKAMRERLRRYVGSAAYKIEIATFHGFSQQLIARYPDAYSQIIGGQAATDIDKITLLESILDDPSLSTLRPSGNPAYYVKPLMGVISDLKREYVTPDKLHELIEVQEAGLKEIEQYHEKGAHKGKERGEYKDAVKSIEKNRALLAVYRRYQAGLRGQQLFDFDDMIMETVDALKENEDMLRDLQEQYQYIHADEHQDVNGSQNAILELLANYHDRPNIFVVGDEKQAIFRFQGASLENFLHFETLFTDTEVISLTENYRSGQPVLDAGHSLIQVEDGPLAKLRVPLHAAAVPSAEVTLRDFSHQAIEDQWLLDEVKRQIEEGIPASEIAVIVRSNREVEAISTALCNTGVAAVASAESDVLHHPITHTVEQLLRATIKTDTTALFTVLHGSYWNLSSADVVRICSAQNYSQSLYDIISSEDILQEVKVQNVDQVQQISQVLTEASARSTVEAPQDVLAYLLDATGLKDHVLQHDPYGAARVIRRLYDEIESLVKRDPTLTLDGVLRVFTQRREYNLPLSAPFIGVDSEAVQVMTAHKSKGLEFEAVFAPHLVDSVWGGKKQRQLFKIPHQSDVAADASDDEKRLLYVLLTRAKTQLHLSSSELNIDGKPLSPSRLLSEIEEELLSVQPTNAQEDAFGPLDSVVPVQVTPLVDTSVAASLFVERGFSATSLNNFLRSPWEYYFKNLLRVPATQPAHMLFGTAVHSVLERVSTTHTKTGAVPSDNEIITSLEQALQKLPLTTTEYTRLHKKGVEILIPYVAEMRQILPKVTKEEFSISVMLPSGDPDIPDIPLRGNLDRLDFDESGNLRQVTDYKTGKPKSRNVIEGNTQSSDGSYKRQLVFYALLLELYDDERYRCNTGVLSFVESATAGKIKEEVFTVSNEEVAALRSEIVEAARTLLNGSWATQMCDPGECDYCHLLQK